MLVLVYLALLGFRPWADLSRAQRRFVWVDFVHPFLSHWPVNLAKSCLLWLALMAVVWPSGLHGAGGYIAFFLVAMFTTDVLDLLLVVGYRRRIGQYIQEHEPEIKSVV